MTVRVGINGFGRIGRSFTRALLARGEAAGVELVAVNDPFGDSHTMAFLLKHDSVGGMLPNEVKETANGFSIDGNEIKKLEEQRPGRDPVGRERRRRRHRVDRSVHRPREGGRPPQGWGEAGRDLRAERRRRRDDLHGRERRGLRPRGAHRHLQRVVHHELPRADGEGAERPVRHRGRASSPRSTPTRPTSSSRTRRPRPAAASRTSAACAPRRCRSSRAAPARPARSASCCRS